MDVVVKIDNPSLHTDIMKLQAAIKQGLGDLAAARSMVEQCPSDDLDTIVNEVSHARRLSLWSEEHAVKHLTISSRVVFYMLKSATHRRWKSLKLPFLSEVRRIYFSQYRSGG